ncbi:hypothetical protein [[Roseibacterium] beibuensis]|uniref:Phage tail protein n=1 Tax=[Roseibacterium] beibuensis TaxID=1193142 RepID=A0ABP9L7H2_9RHOB|nr:hypothetical protein [Roseibacterium beibuensis]
MMLTDGMGWVWQRRVTVGEGDPATELRHRHATEDEARRAAQAERDRGMRASGKINVTLAGFRGELMAEGIVALEGIKPELAGAWTLDSVRHELGSDRLQTSFTAERDNERAGATTAPAEDEANVAASLETATGFVQAQTLLAQQTAFA